MFDECDVECGEFVCLLFDVFGILGFVGVCDEFDLWCGLFYCMYVFDVVFVFEF